MSAQSLLVIGANGQVGSELVTALAQAHGEDNVFAADLAPASCVGAPRYLQLDVLDPVALAAAITANRVTEVYHLAAVLSAVGEREPQRAWNVNMTGLLNVLDVARLLRIEKVFWPSSIAAFGPGTMRESAPQQGEMDPQTVYGISKLAGERWCEWYHHKHGVDVRSLRYPGLVSYKAPPGGGTTDYAVQIFHAAKTQEEFRCFVKPETKLPMMYMPDALRATIELMQAPAGAVRVRSSYNVAGLSFTVAELVAAVQRHVPELNVAYKPDWRQAIADSWPMSIDDSAARSDWGWKPRYDLEAMVVDMLANLRTERAAA